MRALYGSVLFVTALACLTDSAAAKNKGKQQREDVVLAWNQVMLDSNAIDSALAIPDQPGPTYTSRAFAIVSIAMFEAYNAIDGSYDRYGLDLSQYRKANADAAVATAAYEALCALYPQQCERYDDIYEEWMSRIKRNAARDMGVELGTMTALNILEDREGDGSELDMPYLPGTGPGYHQADPINPDQGYLAPLFGSVWTFAIGDVTDFISPPPPALDSYEYYEAYVEAYTLGGDDPNTTLRTDEQTEIGIFWAYDGTPGLGKPPRLYNQVVRVIARDRRNTTAQNARLFALVNIAMADAGIQSWATKYTYEFWRPVVAIREGEFDGNPLTIGDSDWSPLGAPYSNGPTGAPNFTPPFPAYSSGHATFGAAALWTVALFYGTDEISFDFMSDEFNGVNTDQYGNVRPVVVRHYERLSDAILENALSRIYLGIHWRFDAQEGIRSGMDVAECVYDRILQPVVPTKKKKR